MRATDAAPWVAMAITVIVWTLTQVVAVIVWTLTQRANRKHEIFKERFRRRVDMFDSLLPDIANFVYTMPRYFADPENQQFLEESRKDLEKLCSYRVKMLCWGTKGEQQAFEEFLDAIENYEQLVDLPRKNEELVDLVLKNLRKETDIE